MSTNEIITLQFGHFSNYIGAHWWNLQENSFSYDVDTLSEINHDVLYREGVNHMKEVTYTPRLLLADLKGSLGCLSTCSDLYEEKTIFDITEDTVTWFPDKLQVEHAPEYEKNEFLVDIEKEEAKMTETEIMSIDKFIQRYELDDKIQYWSDYSVTRFHPRTFSVINKFEHNAKDAFCSYGQGIELWKSELFIEEWTDKCRAYAEECDYLQGFHLLLDCDDGFSGLGCSALLFLQDEYAGKSVFTIPTQPSSYSDYSNSAVAHRIINNVLTYGDLVESSAAFVPLSVASEELSDVITARNFPNLRYNEKLWYHSSAILAAYLEAVTVGYRRRGPTSVLSGILSNLTPCGRKLLSGSMRLPFPVYPEFSILESLETLTETFWTTLTPSTEIALDMSPLQDICVRGLSSFSLVPSAKKRSTNPAYQYQTLEEMMTNFLNFCASGSKVRANITNVKMPLKIPASYPNIFDDRVTRIGCISETPLPIKFAVAEAPVFAGLHNCASASNLLANLVEKSEKISLNQMSSYSASGLEKLEYLESVEKILVLKDNYC